MTGSPARVGSVDAARPMMGGLVSVHVAGGAPEAVLATAAEAALDRLEAWAARLTRLKFSAEGAEVLRLPTSPKKGRRHG